MEAVGVAMRLCVVEAAVGEDAGEEEAFFWPMNFLGHLAR